MDESERYERGITKIKNAHTIEGQIERRKVEVKI